MARVPVTIKIPPPRVVPLMVRSPFKKVICGLDWLPILIPRIWTKLNGRAENLSPRMGMPSS